MSLPSDDEILPTGDASGGEARNESGAEGLCVACEVLGGCPANRPNMTQLIIALP